MAVSRAPRKTPIEIPAGCYRQSNETEGSDAQGNETFGYILKGPHDTLKALKNDLLQGDVVVAGWVAQHWQLARNPGDCGTLTITCAPDDDETDDSGEEPVTEQVALEETWTLKSCRNDVSILAYCGTGDSNPSREHIEAWAKEPDGELAAAGSYRKPDGTVFPPDDGSATDTRWTASLEVIAKMRKGIESVMRFYPMLVKTRVYSRPPATVYENLAYICTPSVTGTSRKLEAPGNLAQIISAHEWLKCQDDTDKQADGKFRRIEAWIGVLKADGGWDENLYGTDNRWPMPYDHTGGAS